MPSKISVTRSDKKAKRYLTKYWNNHFLSKISYNLKFQSQSALTNLTNIRYPWISEKIINLHPKFQKYYNYMLMRSSIAALSLSIGIFRYTVCCLFKMHMAHMPGLAWSSGSSGAKRPWNSNRAFIAQCTHTRAVGIWGSGGQSSPLSHPVPYMLRS